MVPGGLPAGHRLADPDHAAVFDDNLFHDRQANPEPGIARADVER